MSAPCGTSCMFEPAPDRSRRSPTREPASTSLPYDPEEWERRLAAARVQREKVLQERAAGRQQTDLALGHGAAVAKSDEPPRLTTIFPKGVEAARQETYDRSPHGCDATVADRRPPAAEGPQVAPFSPKNSGRLRPVLFGVVVGMVAGTSLAGFGGISDGIGALRGRLMPLSPFAAAPFQDGAKDVAPVLAWAPPHLPARAPFEDRHPVPLPSVTVDAAPTPIAALTAPAMPVASSPAIPAALLVLEPRPTIGEIPEAPELASPGLQHEILTAALDVELARGDPPVSAVPPGLTVPEVIEVAAPEAGLAPAPRWQVSRVVVHAPERIARDRRQAALSSLADSEWPAEKAVPSPYTIGETHVRYYHSRDRAAARELAKLFDAAARDFTSYSPSPDEGFLELWLAGQGAPPQPKPVRTHTDAERETASTPRLFTRTGDALAGASGGARGGTRGDGIVRRPSSASDGSRAASASRPASPERARASPGADGRQTNSGTGRRDRSRAPSDRASSDPSPGSGGDRASNGSSSNGGGRGNGGNRGGGAADNNGGGKGNSGVGHDRGGGNDRGRDAIGAATAAATEAVSTVTEAVKSAGLP